MTTPAFQNSFTSASTIFATMINSNWADWVSILGGGTYSFNVGNLTAQTATISGNVSLGTGSSQTVSMNGYLNTHLIGSGVDLGTTTLPFGNAYVDNGTSHAGALYFDGGTTAYVDMTSGATSLEFGGFSYIDFNSGAVTNAATFTATNVTIGTDITASGMVYGNRANYFFRNQSLQIQSSTTKWVGIEVSTSVSMAYLVIRTGSVATIGYNILNCQLLNGPSLIGVRLYQNGSSIYTIMSATVTSDGVANSGVISLTKNSYPVNASDTIGVVIDTYTPGTGTFNFDISVDLYEDS